jgi:hypothetical protein
MNMALSQPLRAWQLARERKLRHSLPGILVAGALAWFFPATASAQLDADPMQESTTLDSFPHVIVLDDANLPIGLSGEDAAEGIQAAIDTWNEVGCSRAELAWGGVVDEPGTFEEDTTPVVFADPDEERCFGAETNIGWTVLTPCCNALAPEGGCEGRQYPRYTIFLNTRDFEWDDAPSPYQAGGALRVDIRSVVTHELGHVLGLSHNQEDTLATMAPRYLRDGGLASLAASDKREVCARYPQAVDECVSDADCPGGGPCVAIDEWRVCDEYRAEAGQFCALDHLDCPDGCFISSPATYSGYCTAPCTDDRDCPDDFVCDPASRECRLAVLPREPVGCSIGQTHPSGEKIWLYALTVAAMIVTIRRRRW